MTFREEPAPAPLAQRVTASIVSHGHGEYVRRLLVDLDAAGHAIERIVLTRNIPEPGLLEGLALRTPLTVIDNPAPLGFGANHNAAFGHCASPWFLVLNPDVRMDPGVLPGMLARAPAQAGVVAPRVVEPGRPRPEPRRGLLTPFEIIGRRLRRDYDAPRAEWVAGMFMLFRAPAFEAVGGFDEKFFMYVEDADICARLSLMGWEVAVDESARILHDAQRDSHRHWRPLAWHWQSLLRWWFSPVFWRKALRKRRPGSPRQAPSPPAGTDAAASGRKRAS